MDTGNYFSDAELHLLDANDMQKHNMYNLRDKILNPIRKHFGKAIYCTSGHRSPAHNARVGGAADSTHLCENGYAAADISSPHVKIIDLFHHIRLTYPYAQLILEEDQGVIHVALNIEDVKNSKYIATRKLVYEVWDEKKV